MYLKKIINHIKAIKNLENYTFYYSGGLKSNLLLYILTKILEERQEKMKMKIFIADRTSFLKLKEIKEIFDTLNAYNYFNIFIVYCGECNLTPNDLNEIHNCPLYTIYAKHIYTEEVIIGECRKSGHTDYMPKNIKRPFFELDMLRYHCEKILKKINIDILKKTTNEIICNAPYCPYYYLYYRKWYNTPEEAFYYKNNEDMRKKQYKYKIEEKTYNFIQYYTIKEKEFLKELKNIKKNVAKLKKT